MTRRTAILNLALCLMGITDAAAAGQRIPLACQRNPDTTLCDAYRAPSPAGPARPQGAGLRQAPDPDQPQRPPTTNRNYAGEAVDKFPEKLERRVLREIDRELPGTRKPLKKGLNGIRFFEDPVGYVWDSTAGEAVGNYVDGVTKRAVQALPNGSAAKKLLKGGSRVVTGPGGVVADVLLDPEEISTRQGVAGRPENYTAIDDAYEALKDGSCLPRNLLSLSPKSGPVHRPTPGNCASREELQAYVDGYNRAFDAIASQERAQWSSQRDLMQMAERAMAEAEKALQDPSMSPADRAWLREILDGAKRQFDELSRKGIMPSQGGGSGSGSFSNDRIKDAYQDMDSKMSIKPWR